MESSRRQPWFLVLLLSLLLSCSSVAQNRVTILSDAFGKNGTLAPVWGYSALIEFEGKRILFDTGGDNALFQQSLQRMHVDLSHLDMVIISHAHGDHTSGLRYVLSLNPNVPLFVPDDDFFTGKELPHPFLATNADPTLPAEMRYYGGKAPAHIQDWLAYSDTKMTVVNGPVSLAPHIRLVALVSSKAAFAGLHEISLVLDTPKGAVIVAGCSHPGIEQILAAATASDPKTPVYMLFGGLHLVLDTREQIEGTLNVIADQYHVQKMAVGHCTGERAFSMIKQKWAKNDEYAGLGEVIPF